MKERIKDMRFFFFCKLCLIFRNLDSYLKYPFVSDLMLRRKKKKKSHRHPYWKVI